MTEIERKITSVRPSLRKVAPLTFWICWGYALVNIILGAGMYFLYLKNPVVPIVVANILSYQVWGVLFWTLGLITGYALITNRWHLTRSAQFVGLFLKTIWGIALIIRSFSAPTTLLITGVWIFLAYVQVMVYIYFIPEVGQSRE